MEKHVKQGFNLNAKRKKKNNLFGFMHYLYSDSWVPASEKDS